MLADMDLRRSRCSLPRRFFLGITAAALARSEQLPMAKPAIVDAVPFQRYIGLAGLRPRADSTVEVNPLIPAAKWDWLCLDRIPYHGRSLTILWDKSGAKFGQGKGPRVLGDAKEIAHVADLGRVTGTLA